MKFRYLSLPATNRSPTATTPTTQQQRLRDSFPPETTNVDLPSSSPLSGHHTPTSGGGTSISSSLSSLMPSPFASLPSLSSLSSVAMHSLPSLLPSSSTAALSPSFSSLFPSTSSAVIASLHDLPQRLITSLSSPPLYHTHLWQVGVILSLAASFIGALGDNLVRLSFVKENEEARKRNEDRRNEREEREGKMAGVGEEGPGSMSEAASSSSAFDTSIGMSRKQHSSLPPSPRPSSGAHPRDACAPGEAGRVDVLSDVGSREWKTPDWCPRHRMSQEEEEDYMESERDESEMEEQREIGGDKGGVATLGDDGREKGRNTMSRRKPLWRRRLWWMGEILTVVVNPILTLLAFRFAAASMVLPFGGLHIVFNLLIVAVIQMRHQGGHHHHPSSVSHAHSSSTSSFLPSHSSTISPVLAGSLLIVAGTVGVVSCGAHRVPAYSIAQFPYVCLLQPSFLLFSAIVVLFSGVCAYVSIGDNWRPVSSSPERSDVNNMNCRSRRISWWPRCLTFSFFCRGGKGRNKFKESATSLCSPTTPRRQKHMMALPSAPLSSSSPSSPQSSSSYWISKPTTSSSPCAVGSVTTPVPSTPTNKSAWNWFKKYAPFAIATPSTKNRKPLQQKLLRHSQELPAASTRNFPFFIFSRIHCSEAFCCCTATGLFGAMGNIMAKSVIEVVSNTTSTTTSGGGAVGTVGVLHYGWFYFILAIAIGMSILQLIFLNLALSRHSVLFVVPLVNAVLIVGGSIGGGLLFREFHLMEPPQQLLFWLGVGGVVAGMLLLADKTTNTADWSLADTEGAEDQRGRRRREDEKQKRGGELDKQGEERIGWAPSDVTRGLKV
eukprot:GHVS01025052.1.p1 GENE.GHVS01025052.1~~GHVS01025052.1.p1  ORF type:complete len:834 (-),score=183.14 GHVS01025052.1:204-2705(-)